MSNWSNDVEFYEVLPGKTKKNPKSSFKFGKQISVNLMKMLERREASLLNKFIYSTT